MTFWEEKRQKEKKNLKTGKKVGRLENCTKKVQKAKKIRNDNFNLKLGDFLQLKFGDFVQPIEHYILG